MIKLMFTASLALLLSANCAVASEYSDISAFPASNEESDKPNIDFSGLYGGASAGYSLANCSYSDSKCNNAGWKLYGGYQVNDMMAVEAGYYGLGDYTTDINHYQLGEIQDVNVQATGVALSGVGSYPLREDLDLFGKLGIMKWKAKATAKVGTAMTETELDDSGTGLLFGGGATYRLSENLGLRGEYEHVTGDLGANLFSAGVNYSTY